MKRLAILLAVLGTLAYVPTAQAKSHVTGPAVEWVSPTVRALRIAERVWGPAPCGSVRIEYALPTGADIRGQAWADMPGADQRCVIWLQPGARKGTFPIYCSLILHEWGHLTGHEHSANPASVMSAGLSFAEDRGTINGRVTRTRFTGTARQCR